jgi:hypothetical protein
LIASKLSLKGPEGYLLNAGNKLVVVAGYDDAGAFFGYHSQEQDYGKVVSAPIPSNALLLAGISKVVKRTPYIPK